MTSCEEPKEAWGNLCGHFERETLANKLFFKKQYFRTEMKEGTSVEAHLKQMKEITDRLAAIGAPISEEDQVVTLLGSLPPSYSNLVTALESRIDSVKLSYVQQALIHEEMKRREQPSDSHLAAQQTLHSWGHMRRGLLEELSDVLDVLGWVTFVVSAVLRKETMTTRNQHTRPR